MDDAENGHPNSPRQNDMKVRATATMHIGPNGRRAFMFPDRKKKAQLCIFSLLPVTGQRFIIWSTLGLVFVLASSLSSIYILGNDHWSLARLNWAAMVCNTYAVGLVWDGVYSEVKTRLVTVGFLSFILALIAVGGFLESTTKWQQSYTLPQEHWVYLGSMFVIALTSIINISYVVHCVFLPGMGWTPSKRPFRTGAAPNGRPLIPKDSNSENQRMMREVYQRFVSSLNLDLALTLTFLTLCYDDYKNEDPSISKLGFWEHRVSELVYWVLAIVSPPWAMFLWLSVVNELHLPMYVLLYPPLPFLLAFVGAQAIRIRRFSLENNSMRVHMIVVCLCGLFTLLGRVQLFWNADEVRHFFGRRLKSEVNRLRFYLEEPKHIRSSGGTVCRYGTLCA
mmetsp:Transcript_14623/g.29590  ORF Transcript_14623/g.29590 Transcript_14623/m.29590 type:complete len:394 (-) Transcript_14623:181-1362(-)